jgi:hypothetical protein
MTKAEPAPATSSTGPCGSLAAASGQTERFAARQALVCALTRTPRVRDLLLREAAATAPLRRISSLDKRSAAPQSQRESENSDNQTPEMDDGHQRPAGGRWLVPCVRLRAWPRRRWPRPMVREGRHVSARHVRAFVPAGLCGGRAGDRSRGTEAAPRVGERRGRNRRDHRRAYKTRTSARQLAGSRDPARARQTGELQAFLTRQSPQTSSVPGPKSPS